MQPLSFLLDQKIYKDPRLKKSLGLLRLWMGPERARRPDNYLNQEAFFNAYLAYYLPLHLPELFWVLEQGKRRGFEFSAKSVLDVGAGPGTLSLSLLLWLKKEKRELPEEIVLWDQSERALKFAKEKLKTLSPKTRIRFEKTRLPQLPPGGDFDLILMGHLLNEWGAGPRLRDKKSNFVRKVMAQSAEEASLIVLEPPLRETSMDLMSLRDDFATDFEIVAPCPQSTRECPLLKQKLGWCYSQPARNFCGDVNFQEFDRHIERLLSIQLTQSSFSYMWLSKSEHKLHSSATYVTDPKAPRSLLCSEDGTLTRSQKASRFRGEIKAT